MAKSIKSVFSQGFNFYLVLIIINFPKINLLTIAGFKQGIRLDDLLILLFCLFNIKNIHLTKQSFLVFVYITLTFLFSFVHQSNSIYSNYVNFHYLRFIQYFLLYIILLERLDQKTIIKLAVTTLIFQFLISIINFLFFYTVRDEFDRFSRASGTTAGPWELTMMLGTLYFILSDHFKKTKQNLFEMYSYISVWVLIIISYSRIVAIAFIIILALQRFKLFIFLFFFVIFTILFFGDIISSGIQISEKLHLSYFNLERTFNFIRDYGGTIVENWSRGDFYLGDRGDYYDSTSKYYDPSLVGRLQQWGRYLSITKNSELIFFAILFGNGPGSGGIINDGMYIKLLIDFGLVGLLFYIFLIIKLFLVKKEVRFLLIFISISCITLDFYWPTKIAYSLILAMCYFDKKNYLKKN